MTRTLVQIIDDEKLHVGARHGGRWTDKEGPHVYCSGYYDSAFKRFVGKRPRVLEIGLWNGGSLVLWQRYFGDGAKIVGADIADHGAVANAKGLPGVSVVIADAYTSVAADKLGDEFDIIVDDGPHTAESQATAVKLYSAKLSEAGILVVEDVATDKAIDMMIAAVPAGCTHKVVDLRGPGLPPDNRLFVVRRA